MILHRYTPSEWAPLSENAHAVAFGTSAPVGPEKVDFVHFVTDEKDVPMGYGTFSEASPGTLYCQFMGAFPGTRGTGATLRMARFSLSVLAEEGKYKRLTCLVDNRNLPALKLMGHLGFRITGLTVRGGETLVEHTREVS